MNWCKDNPESLHGGLTDTHPTKAGRAVTPLNQLQMKNVLLIHREKKKKKKRQSKCQILTFTLRNADILIEPLPFCEKDFSKRQFKIMLRQLKKPQDQLVSIQLMLIDWLNFPITIQGLPYSMQHNQRLPIKAGGRRAFTLQGRGRGHTGQAPASPQAQGQSDRMTSRTCRLSDLRDFSSTFCFKF